MSIASQIERLQGVRKEINTKLQELKLTDTDKDFQGISDTLNTVVTNPVINDTLTVTQTSVTVPKGFYDTEGTVNIVTEEKTATTNGEVIPTEGKVLSKVIVNVPSTTVKLQEKTATPSQAEQVISPDSGYDGLSKVTINGDSDLVATNIKQGINIFGIEGTYQGEQAKLQEKTATPSKEQQVINADEGYDGLSQVTINGDEDLIADNIKKDVNIFGVVGTYEGSGGGGTEDLSGIIDRSITSVTIPSDVTKIGEYAFAYCLILKNIVLPETLKTIGINAFYKCSDLQSIIIPESVTKIGISAFEDCGSLSEINIPNNITVIDTKTFYYCSSLENIILPSTITDIRSSAFWFSSLKTINLPEGLLTIGDSAFRACSSLQLDTLPETLEEIGSYAFMDCTNLSISKLPDSITKLNQRAFNNCPNITINKFSSNLKEISLVTFGNCTGITKLYIPSTVTKILATSNTLSPFSGCTNLTDIYTDATEKPAGWGQYFNYINRSTQATVHYGVSEEEFDAIVGGA